VRTQAAGWIAIALTGVLALPATASTDTTATGSRVANRPLWPSSDDLEWNELHLGRAAMQQSLGNPRGVIESLEALDLSAARSFAEADRAAFLLGQAYLKVGSPERFTRLARVVARWEQETAYTRWLAFQLLVAETDGTSRPEGGSEEGARPDVPITPDSLGGTWAQAARGNAAQPDSMTAPDTLGSVVADALAAGLLIRRGESAAALRLLDSMGSRPESAALIAFMRVLALEAQGQDTGAALAALATVDTTTALGRDLAGAAFLRQAARALAQGKDPAWLLDRVPREGRYASRARHMQGLAALESGAAEQGLALLESLLADDSTYVARREAALAVGGQRLDEEQWTKAHETYRRIDQDWAQHRRVLQQMRAAGRSEQLWSSWEMGLSLSDALLLDALPARILSDRNAAAAADLTARPLVDEVPPLPAIPLSPPRFAIAPPPPESRRAVAASSAHLADAVDSLVRSRRALTRERATREDRLRYLGGGLRHTHREQDTLAARAGFMDSLQRTLHGLDARLQAVRDQSKRRVAQRGAVLLQAAGDHLAWLQAMRHFYVDGPNQERRPLLPPGFPSRDSLTRVEEVLASAIQAFSQHLTSGAPDLIERSYQHAWRPNLIERSAASRMEAHRLIAWAKTLGPAIQSAIAAAAANPAPEALAAQVKRDEGAVDSLRGAHESLRARVAAEAIERALAALDEEREAIDYGLAASAYGLSVRLSRRDSTAGPDSSAIAAHAPEDDLDDPQAVAWRARALEALQGFLERHPRSFARGEMRFRLADLLFVDARHAFRERMAIYMRAQSEGQASRLAVPVMDQTPALNLYRTILEEDRDFAHLDAVLFNAGMLLADQGDPEAARFFSRLVSAYPTSRYRQETHLKMGDLHFDEGRLAECIPLYQRAADGDDPTFQAIALYKMGWAHFNREHLAEAAESFRAVLDLYGAASRSRIQVDVEGEAETYLVHTLARAGGAQAFTEHFDRIGPRPYERSVLKDLGQHFRRYSLFAEAAAAEELYLRRYPLDAEALMGAQRLADTYQRWDRAELARKARLEYASRFAPAGDWAKAQTSDSLRAAGAEFARGAWKSVALDHHRDARARGAREDWSEALRLYQVLLQHWPDDPESPRYRLFAGEASARLGDYRGALTHLAAAESAPDSIAQQAAFQRVVVTDAWYESARAAPAGAPGASKAATASLPPDSLARAVLSAGDHMLARYPQHPEVHDVMWRQGNVALAHGWFERAAQDFEKLTHRFPNDRRAPAAAHLRGDALFRIGNFQGAGAAFESAERIARAAGHDSLERRAAEAVPVCYYRHAEAVAKADSTDHARHAALFEQVATRWPRYEHAHLAQYRAGLAYLRAGRKHDAVRAMEWLIERFPSSEFVKDAHLQAAKIWEASEEREKAARAYAAFAERYPDDASAGAAWLKAADLLAAAGQDQEAERLRLGYMRKFPQDVETGAEILETLARRELSTVGPERPLSTLLPGRAPRGKAASPSQAEPAPSSHLAEYLWRMEKHPHLVSRELLAQVQFLQGQEAERAYADCRLTQPLEKSIPIKQKLLDSLIAPYRRSVDLGGSEWGTASAFRIGQALVGFGVALEESERPADLKGDDLLAYADVLREQAQAFYDRGEEVWMDLLRQHPGGGPVNPWIAKTQTALWQRLGDRFSYRPEVDFPLVLGAPPEKPRPHKGRQGEGR
jgi:tetratricopeptide (TPR) repeat protein